MDNLSQEDEELIQTGLEKDLIDITDDRIHYITLDKSDIWTDPEEKVRAAAYCKLALEWLYPPNNLDKEVYPPEREPENPADLVVGESGGGEGAFIVVECKPEPTKNHLNTARRQGVGNSNLLNADWLYIKAGSKEEFYYVKNCDRQSQLDSFSRPDLPKMYGEEPQYRFVSGKQEPSNVGFEGLRRRFSNCHDELWGGGKRDPAAAFDEMSKLMFAKIYDERFTEQGKEYKFQIGTNETPIVIGERVKNELYEEAQEAEPEVFQDEIEVSDTVIYRVVEELQDISLLDSDLDAKGRAYEQFLGKIFKGELGQFFTPRTIIDFMVRFSDPDESEIAMDPACGSSGFLLYSMRYVNTVLEEKYDEDTAKRLSWDFSHDNVFGIEINDRIARIAMMDMVIHDDGHSNIECNDALADFDSFDPRKDIQPGKYSLVLTNPPFSGREKKKSILQQYELGVDRPSRKPGVLFVERCMELLSPGGVCGIVLPDGILKNEGHIDVRDFVNSKAELMATISLPNQTFKPYEGADKTSILFFQKGANKETPIFMAEVQKVGFTSTGREDENNLPFILEEYRRFLENPEEYTPGEKREEKHTFTIDRDFLQDRFDPAYYRPEVLETIKQIEGSNHEVVNLKEVVEKIDTGKTFNKVDYQESGEVFSIKVKNLKEDGIDWYESKYSDSYTNKETYEENESSRVEEGDILLTSDAHSPDYIGKEPCLVRDIPEEFNDKVLYSGEVMCIRFDEEEINPEYLLYYLRSNFGRTQVLRILTGQTAHLYPGDMKNLFRVIKPPKEKQDEVCDWFNQAHEKRNDHLEKANELKDEINQAYTDFGNLIE